MKSWERPEFFNSCAPKQHTFYTTIEVIKIVRLVHQSVTSVVLIATSILVAQLLYNYKFNPFDVSDQSSCLLHIQMVGVFSNISTLFFFIKLWVLSLNLAWLVQTLCKLLINNLYYSYSIYHFLGVHQFIVYCLIP